MEWTKPRWRARQAGCAALLALACATAGATEVYKWVDANGKVHFGDRRPAANATTVDVHPTPAAGDGAMRHYRTKRQLEALTSERLEREGERQAAKEEARERKRKCHAAQDEQYRREHAAHLFYRDENGEKRIIEGAEYDAEIERARQAVRKWCG